MSNTISATAHLVNGDDVDHYINASPQVIIDQLAPDTCPPVQSLTLVI